MIPSVVFTTLSSMRIEHTRILENIIHIILLKSKALNLIPPYGTWQMKQLDGSLAAK